MTYTIDHMNGQNLATQGKIRFLPKAALGSQADDILAAIRRSADITLQAESLARTTDTVPPKSSGARSITGFSIVSPRPLSADRQTAMLQRQGRTDAARIEALQARHRASRGAA